MGVRWPVGYANLVYHFTMSNIDGEATAGLGIKDDGGGFSVSDCNDIFTSFVAQGLMSHQSLSVILTKITMSTGPSHPGGPFYTSTNAPQEGGEAGDQLIPNTTSLVRKYTAVGGRAGRGRMYLPLVRDGDVDFDGTIDSSTLSDLQSSLDDHISDIVALGYLTCLFHDSSSTPTLLTNLTIEPMVATQRGRLHR